MNLGDEPFIVETGDRIAQIVLNKVPRIIWNGVRELPKTSRTGGFGSTGVK